MEIKNYGLLQEDIRESDHILGSENKHLGAIKFEPLIEPVDGYITWSPYAPENEYQWKDGVETNACVSFSKNNQIEYLLNYYKKEDPAFFQELVDAGVVKNGLVNFSDRRTAKGSGTDPNSGNYVSAVEDYVRNNLFCPEDLWAFPAGMSRDEYYKAMPNEVRDYGKKLEPIFQLKDKYLPMEDNIYKFWVDSYLADWQKATFDGLRYSPIWASVLTPYEFTDGLISSQRLKANIKQGQRTYSHRITITGAKWGEYWEVHDHYLSQKVKFQWDYLFSGRKAAQILKKKTNPTTDFVLCDGSKDGFHRSLWLKDKVANDGTYISVGEGDVVKTLPKWEQYQALTPISTMSEFPPNKGKTLAIVDWNKWQEFIKS